MHQSRQLAILDAPDGDRCAVWLLPETMSRQPPWMIKFFFSSKKQLFSKLNLHYPNLCPLLGLGFRVWRLGSRDKGLGFRV